MTNTFGIHVATTCPSITTTDSATAGDFPVGSEVPAPTVGEQLLPSAPTQRTRKPLLTLPSFSHAFSPSIHPLPQNSPSPVSHIIPGGRLSRLCKRKRRSGPGLFTAQWLWKAQRCCDSPPDGHHVCTQATEPHIYIPYSSAPRYIPTPQTKQPNRLLQLRAAGSWGPTGDTWLVMSTFAHVHPDTAHRWGGPAHPKLRLHRSRNTKALGWGRWRKSEPCHGDVHQ